jgi:hypothetical protein
LAEANSLSVNDKRALTAAERERSASQTNRLPNNNPIAPLIMRSMKAWVTNENRTSSLALADDFSLNESETVSFENSPLLALNVWANGIYILQRTVKGVAFSGAVGQAKRAVSLNA